MKKKSYEKYKKWLSLNAKNLEGKIVAITGSTGGLGKEISRYLAHLGASIVLVNRNQSLSEAQKNELLCEFPNASVKCVIADMTDTDSVKEAAKKLIEEDIDVFISNAGAYSIPRKILDTGYDNVYQINFISPYYMLKELIPTLERKGGRAVIVGSIAHNYSRVDETSVDFRDRNSASKVYGNAKRYLMYSALTLADDLKKAKITVTHPGITFTNITSHYPKLIFALIKHPMKIIFMKPEKAALSILKGVFADCENKSWIGPRLFNVWGLPSIKVLKSASDDEIKFIKNTADNIYFSL